MFSGIQKLLTLVLAFSIVTSCVGTIKNKNAELSTTQSSAVDVSSFSGLTIVNPIADDKVELYFYPVSGAQTNVIYAIYVNGSTTAITVSGTSLTLNTRGMFRTVVKDLQMNTNYTFNMKAIDSSTGSTSSLDATKALTTTTFANKVANFEGISTVELVPGVAGQTSAIVKWVSASSIGGDYSPRATDPTSYEITYISNTDGILNINSKGTKKYTVELDDDTGLTKLSKDTSYTVTGLQPGTRYYFQVRAIHKNFYLYSSDTTYKYDSNTKYLSITTLTSNNVFDFLESSIKVTNPEGVTGLSKLNVSWATAEGPFANYKVCYKKIAEPDASSVPSTDYYIDSNTLDISSCVNIDATANYYTIAGLTPYAYYQVKVIACLTGACAFNDRKLSIAVNSRVVTNVASFGGILSLKSPDSASDLNTIKINFDPPVTGTGYLNFMKLSCYSSSTDSAPYDLPTDGTLSSSSKSTCNGITSQTIFPSHVTTLSPTAAIDAGWSLDAETSSFSSLSQVKLSLPAGAIDGIKQYCFSMWPQIKSTYLAQPADATNATLKCFTPKIETPNVLQFPGKETGGLDLCGVETGKNLQINWNAPSGGLFHGYVVFYKEKYTGEYFSFDKAQSLYDGNASGVSNDSSLHTQYHWVKVSSAALLTTNLTDLSPGRKYNVGVLSYLTYSTSTLWSQYNYNVSECGISLPKAKFQEWMNVLAVGPKQDGRYQGSIQKFIPEAINDDDTVQEVKITSTTDKSPDSSDTFAATKRTTVFDGVFGRIDNSGSNPLYQYSNSGIISFRFKDVLLYAGTSDETTIGDQITANNDSVKTKPNRMYGYRIYRSEDNKASWVNVTKKITTVNEYQTDSNSGLIYPATYAWKKRNNKTATSSSVVKFTDYSVSTLASDDGVTDKARVYYYKIVPVFDGSELVYSDTINPSHNIIKIILPPKNMALINRMMANRTTCYEMGLDIDLIEDHYYSCAYNGLSSRNLAPPAGTNDLVFDVGGDTLIDRFEMGFPYSRGDTNVSGSASLSASTTKADFNGYNSTGTKFKGCFNQSTDSFLESNNGTMPATNFSYDQLMLGDCIGTDQAIKAYTGSSTCGPYYNDAQGFVYPGSTGEDLSGSCTTIDYVRGYFGDLINTDSILLTSEAYSFTQSEFLANYYIRASGFGWFSTVPTHYKAGSSNYIYSSESKAGTAWVNIPYADLSGKLHARWLGLNQLFGATYIHSTTDSNTATNQITLWNKTPSQILTSGLYDSISTLAPNADLISNPNIYNKDTTPLARIVTSNASKLPPLQGLGASEFNKICSSYKVQVGFQKSTSTTFSAMTTALSKRIMRKLESTIASAWPSHLSDTDVTNIEKTGCNGSNKTKTGTSSLVKGDSLSLKLPIAGSTTTPFHTGSSAIDQDGISSTEKCNSKYGVQDLVGNLSEINSDQFFCRYLNSSDALRPLLYLGPQGVLSQSVPYSTSMYFDTSIPYYVLTYNNTGSCSPTQLGESSGTYLDGSIFNDIYLPDSTTLNPTVVSKAKAYDQDSLRSIRNGDGSFLDFGNNNIGPDLATDNVFDDTTEYFSVPLGIPIKCNGGNGCSTGIASDNQRITFYDVNYTGSGNPAIKDFPINNSKFTNSGISEVSVVETGNTSQASSYHPITYIDYIFDGTTYATHTKTVSSPESTDFQKVDWKISRNAYLQFFTGGSANSISGRYTFNLTGYTDSDSHYNRLIGSRCAILLEDDN
jgi:hypothetical protein